MDRGGQPGGRIGGSSDGPRLGRSTARLEHTDETYELLRDGTVVATQHQRRSPATRGYSQGAARALLEAAGFVEIVVYGGHRDLAPEDAMLFTTVARRPA